MYFSNQWELILRVLIQLAGCENLNYNMEFPVSKLVAKGPEPDEETSEYFVDELMNTIKDEHILYELVYNADETPLF